MSLSISRDLSDLTPEQPTVDENIEAANKMLKEYMDSLKREEVPMWVVNLVKYIFLEEEKLMDETIARVIEEIQKTELDDQFYKIVAKVMKEKIPGEHFEPIIGTAAIGIGEELRKPEQVK